MDFETLDFKLAAGLMTIMQRDFKKMTAMYDGEHQIRYGKMLTGRHNARMPRVSVIPSIGRSCRVLVARQLRVKVGVIEHLLFISRCRAIRTGRDVVWSEDPRGVKPLRIGFPILPLRVPLSGSVVFWTDSVIIK